MVECIAKTKDGHRCRRQAMAGSKFCFQHASLGIKKTSKKKTSRGVSNCLKQGKVYQLDVKSGKHKCVSKEQAKKLSSKKSNFKGKLTRKITFKNGKLLSDEKY
jgi:hypothetical protein